MGTYPLTTEARKSDAWLAFLRRWSWWIAIGIALTCVAAFVELSEEVVGESEGPSRLAGADSMILQLAAHLRHPWLNGVAMDLTAIGSPFVVALFTLTFGALLVANGDRRGAAVLAASSLASGLLTLVMKRLLERPRPDVVPRLVEVTGLSYPSGHSLASAAVYLTAAFVVARHVPRFPERVAAVLWAAVVVLLIGASRVYLGVHYPSDVLAGMLLGTAWALLMGVFLRRVDTSASAGAPSSGTPKALSRTAERSPLRRCWARSLRSRGA
jgi:undecaprenyl-diphosphatase